LISAPDVSIRRGSKLGKKLVIAAFLRLLRVRRVVPRLLFGALLVVVGARISFSADNADEFAVTDDRHALDLRLELLRDIGEFGRVADRDDIARLDVSIPVLTRCSRLPWLTASSAAANHAFAGSMKQHLIVAANRCANC
jgi:hypothetical protein